MTILLRCMNSIRSISSRRFCQDFSSHRTLKKPPTFITTPIFYVNADPHIGHLYSTVYADAIARFSRLINPEKNIIFSVGTDEHGLKVQRAAEVLQQNPKEYCDKISGNFRSLFDSASISYSTFNRTTDQCHKNAVTKLWNALLEKGFIYKSTYEGFYSVNDECFVPESMIVEKNGQKYSSESGSLLEWHEEDNYMFRLSAMQDKLVDWMDKCLIVRPENFHATLKADIGNAKNLHDISISRLKSRMNWGIEVPNDPSQVIYVWFDALINYLTASGYPDSLENWPPAHLIGKDILKFHGIYWPAFLLAADIEPPNTIYCHSHWLYEGDKMSKSKGNVANPSEYINKFGIDGMRYFLLKAGTPHSDSNFSVLKVSTVLNSDLANIYGNLLSRATSIKINRNQHYPSFESMQQVLELMPHAAKVFEISKNLQDNCYRFYLDGSFYKGITDVHELLYHVNMFISLASPWKMVHKATNSDALDALMFVALESLRIVSILLSPITPNISKSVQNKLNIVDDSLLTWDSARFIFNREPHSISADRTVLYPRVVTL